MLLSQSTCEDQRQMIGMSLILLPNQAVCGFFQLTGTDTGHSLLELGLECWEVLLVGDIHGCLNCTPRFWEQRKGAPTISTLESGIRAEIRHRECRRATNFYGTFWEVWAFAKGSKCVQSPNSLELYCSGKQGGGASSRKLFSP